MSYITIDPFLPWIPFQRDTQEGGTRTSDIAQRDVSDAKEECQSLQSANSYSKTESSNSDVHAASSDAEGQVGDVITLQRDSEGQVCDASVKAGDVTVTSSDAKDGLNDSRTSVKCPANDVTSEKDTYLLARRGSGRRLNASTLTSLMSFNSKSDESGASRQDEMNRLELGNKEEVKRRSDNSFQNIMISKQIVSRRVSSWINSTNLHGAN